MKKEKAGRKEVRKKDRKKGRKKKKGRMEGKYLNESSLTKARYINRNLERWEIGRGRKVRKGMKEGKKEEIRRKETYEGRSI